MQCTINLFFLGFIIIWFFLIIIRSFILPTCFFIRLFFQTFFWILPAQHHHYFISDCVLVLKVLFRPVFICLSSDCFARLLVVVFSFFILFSLPVVTSHGLTFTAEINNFFLIHLFMDLCIFFTVYHLIFLFIGLFVLVPLEIS